MVFNNPTDRPASYSVPDNTAVPNIVRLVEDPDVVKTIRFDELSIGNSPDPVDAQGGNKKVDLWGLEFPVIRINDVIVSSRNLSSMNISMSGFIPTISLTLIYEDNTFIVKNPPKDGDMISLYLRASTDAIQYIRADFIITSSSSRTGNVADMSSTIYLNGKMYIHGFDSTRDTIGYTGTSKEVVRKIASSYGLGFSFNDYDNTNDFQNWIRCRESAENFINDVVSHAWKNNDDSQTCTAFYKAWVDLYYDLCFVNVNKFLTSEENDETVDITFATNVIDMYRAIDMDTSADQSMMAVKFLTNMQNMRNTPFYIKNWTPVTASSIISFGIGYDTVTYNYLHNQNLINASDYDCFVTSRVTPTFDQNKVNSSILQRGRATYDKSQNPDDELARVNYNFVDTYVREEWTGVQYTMSDDDNTKEPSEWAGNVHKNYNIAPYHNSQNSLELNKVYLIVECEGLNLQIMKGERIPVIIGPTSSVEKELMGGLTENDLPSDLDRYYSGFYVVDSVEYSYRPDYNGLSPYTTKFVLKRREWPTPEQI